MLHLCFVCVSLVFFYVCQNPKILFSQNKILDFCLTQVLRKQSVCQTQVKHRANIVSHNSAHLQRRWKHVRDSWDTWLPEWFVDLICVLLMSRFVFYCGFTCVLFMMSFRCVYDSLVFAFMLRLRCFMLVLYVFGLCKALSLRSGSYRRSPLGLPKGYMNYWKTLLIFIGKYGIQTSLHTVEQCSKPSVAPVFCFVNGVNRDSHHGVC